MMTRQSQALTVSPSTSWMSIKRCCVALVVLSSMTACVEEQSFKIVQNQTTISGTDGCVGNPVETTFLTRGLLDILGRRGYYMFPRVVSELVSSTEDDPSNPERRRLDLREFRIKLDFAAIEAQVDPNIPREYRVPVSGFLDPGDRKTFALKAIPDGVAQALPSNGEIVIELRAVADRQGAEMESGPLYFPIELCAGCLIGQVLETCPTSTISASNSCGIPQDGPVVCCKDPRTAQGDVLCLPNGPSPFAEDSDGTNPTP